MQYFFLTLAFYFFLSFSLFRSFVVSSFLRMEFLSFCSVFIYNLECLHKQNGTRMRCAERALTHIKMCMLHASDSYVNRRCISFFFLILFILKTFWSFLHEDTSRATVIFRACLLFPSKRKIKFDEKKKKKNTVC